MLCVSILHRWTVSSSVMKRITVAFVIGVLLIPNEEIAYHTMN